MTAKPLPKIPDYGKNAIEVDSLSFAYRTDPSGSSLHNLDENSLVFQDLNLTLEKGSRCLLLGSNYSGKSVRSSDLPVFTAFSQQQFRRSFASWLVGI